MDSTIYIGIAVPLVLFAYIGYLWIRFEIDQKNSKNSVE